MGSCQAGHGARLEHDGNKGMVVQKIHDESGVAGRRISCQRFGERLRRFGRAEIFPAHSLLVWPRSKSGQKSVRLRSVKLPSFCRSQSIISNCGSRRSLSSRRTLLIRRSNSTNGSRKNTKRKLGLGKRLSFGVASEPLIFGGHFVLNVICL
jgi:hypothetical protein